MNVLYRLDRIIGAARPRARSLILGIVLMGCPGSSGTAKGPGRPTATPASTSNKKALVAKLESWNKVLHKRSTQTVDLKALLSPHFGDALPAACRVKGKAEVSAAPIYRSNTDDFESQKPMLPGLAIVTDSPHTDACKKRLCASNICLVALRKTAGRYHLEATQLPLHTRQSPFENVDLKWHGTGTCALLLVQGEQHKPCTGSSEDASSRSKNMQVIALVDGKFKHRANLVQERYRTIIHGLETLTSEISVVPIGRPPSFLLVQDSSFKRVQEPPDGPPVNTSKRVLSVHRIGPKCELQPVPAKALRALRKLDKDDLLPPEKLDPDDI